MAGCPFGFTSAAEEEKGSEENNHSSSYSDSDYVASEVEDLGELHGRQLPEVSQALHCFGVPACRMSRASQDESRCGAQYCSNCWQWMQVTFQASMTTSPIEDQRITRIASTRRTILCPGSTRIRSKVSEQHGGCPIRDTDSFVWHSTIYILRLSVHRRI